MYNPTRVIDYVSAFYTSQIGRPRRCRHLLKCILIVIGFGNRYIYIFGPQKDTPLVWC
jgi:hypothetical protein